MNCNANTICKQDGIPQCAHSLSVPVLCFDMWPDEGSVNRNMSPNFLILMTNICCVID
jgi:hypothetical protein